MFSANQIAASSRKEIASVLSMVQQWELALHYPEKIFEVGLPF